MLKEVGPVRQDIAIKFLNGLNCKQKEFLFGVINLNTKYLVIDLDLDDSAFDTGAEVLAACDWDLGTDYSSRKITGWSSISKWLIKDKIMDPEQAEAYEEALWTDKYILGSAKPVKAVQRLSYAAAERNIPQFVSTSREPELRDVTFFQIKKHFSWIPESHINHRLDKTIEGEIYKAGAVIELYERYPNLVHFDDSMNLVRIINDLEVPVSLIGFLKDDDNVSELAADNRVFLPDISVLDSLVHYPDVNVAQSH